MTVIMIMTVVYIVSITGVWMFNLTIKTNQTVKVARLVWRFPHAGRLQTRDLLYDQHNSSVNGN